jgi:aldehyde:ferredoxin oxidoreductase
MSLPKGVLGEAVPGPHGGGDASGGCIFGTFGMDGDDYAAMISALTGGTIQSRAISSPANASESERLFNLKAGFTRRTTRFPSDCSHAGTRGPRERHGQQVSEMPGILPAVAE